MKIKPVKIIPFPDGKDFAITFIDDSDFSTVENTKPVYDFLAQNKINGTKTVWPLKQKRNSAFKKKFEKYVEPNAKSGMTLENPEYLNFVIDLYNSGFEIGLHGIAAGNSYREEIIAGINKFKSIFGSYPRINVFHEKNIENLYAGYYKLDIALFRMLEKFVDKSEYQGHIENSPYFWGDIAADKIKYTRMPFHNILEVNTLKMNPSMPFHDPIRPFVNYWFSNTDGSDCSKFVKLLSKRNIERLEKENGACFIYTHFAKGFLRLDGDKEKLDKSFVEAISRVAQKKNVWLPTASELLDRLLIIKSIKIKQKEYDLSIENTGKENISELTITLQPHFKLNIKNENNLVQNNENRIILQRVLGKAKMVFRANKKGDFSIGSKNNKKIRKERKKIELYNYIGMIFDKLKEKFEYVK